MKLSRSRLAILALLCGTSLTQADILILKNGNKVEGTILQESPTAVRMKYRLTPKIWDEKDFPMTDIQQVVKQTPEEVEVIELRKLLPTPDLMTADKYEQTIQDRLRPFVNKYKGTKEATEVEAIIATYQEEKAKVSNGQAKLEGKWLSAAEAKASEYDIGAFKLLVSLRAKIADQKWNEALREFDKFYNVRTGYPASIYYVEAIREIMVVIEKYDALIAKMVSDQPQALQARNDGLKKLVDPDLSRTKAAIAREQDSWKATYDAERRAAVRWLVPYKYDLRSLQDCQRVVAAERTRLAAYDLEVLRQQNESLGAAIRAIASYNPADAEAAIDRAMKIPGGNPREFNAVLNDVRMRYAAMRGEMAKRQMSGIPTTSGSTAIGGTASAGVDDRVARILAEANGTAPPPAPGTMPAASGTAPAPAPVAPGVAPAPVAQYAPGAPGVAPVAPGVNPALAQQRPMVAPQPMPAQPIAPVAAYVPPPEESSFQTYIIVGMGALLVLLGVMLFQQKKKQQD